MLEVVLGESEDELEYQLELIFVKVCSNEVVFVTLAIRLALPLEVLFIINDHLNDLKQFCELLLLLQHADRIKLV